MPMINIFNQWSSFFDPHTGVSPLPGNLFIPQNYKGWAAILQTKPVRSQNQQLSVEDVEECHFYCGVFPLNVPTETAGQGDIGANDVVQLSISFSFDGAPMTSAEPGVAAKVISLFNGMHMLGTDGYVDSNSTYNRYLESAVSDLTQQFGSNRGTVNSAASPDGTVSPSGQF